MFNPQVVRYGTIPHELKLKFHDEHFGTRWYFTNPSARDTKGRQVVFESRNEDFKLRSTKLNEMNPIRSAVRVGKERKIGTDSTGCEPTSGWGDNGLGRRFYRFLQSIKDSSTDLIMW